MQQVSSNNNNNTNQADRESAPAVAPNDIKLQIDNVVDMSQSASSIGNSQNGSQIFSAVELGEQASEQTKSEINEFAKH